MTSSKIKRLLVLVALAVLVLMAVLFLTRKKPTPAYQLNDFPTAYAYYDKSSFVFSNKRSFVKFDTSTQTTEVLSPELILPEITNLKISKDKKFVLFRTTTQHINDSAGKILSKEKLDLDWPYWWIMNLKSGKLQHLDKDTYDAIFDDNSLLEVLGASQDINSKVVTTFKPDSMELDTVKPVQDIVALYRSGGVLMGLSRNDELIDSEDSTKLYAKDVLLVKTSPYSASVLALRPSRDALSDIYVIDLSERKTKKISTSSVEEFDANWSSDGSKIIIGCGDNCLRILDQSGKLKEKLSFKADGFDSKSVVNPLLLFDNGIVVFSQNEKFFIGGEGFTYSLTVPEDSYTHKLDNATTLSYSTGLRAFAVTSTKPITKDVKQLAYDKIRKDGYNPDMYRIDFNVLPETGSN